MAYKFTFDLSQFSQSFFKEMARFSEKKGIHKKIGKSARYLVRKFKVHKMVGLPVSDALTIIEDMIDTYMKNLSHREMFLKTNRRALFLPHCSRKYMDSRCKAKFNPKLSYYTCMKCSKDCKVRKATALGKKNGYDVYILPGGSCVRKIMTKKRYEGMVGVACCEEIKLAEEYLKIFNIPGQAVPLIKNGCSGTKFSMETLEKTL